MGDLHHTRCMETAMRLARYLGRDTIVSGMSVSGELKQFCATATETGFEEAVASLYTDHRFNSRRRFLMKRWRLLDWLYGDLLARLHRHDFARGQHHDGQARRAYATYLSDRDFTYVDHEGRTCLRGESKYNEHRLEELLPADLWARAQVARHGPDFQPAEHYDTVKYLKPPAMDGVEAPPPHIAEWLLRALRGSGFERKPVG